MILDEVGRGTSTQDGLAIASAILEDLVMRTRCYSMFATHYHELVPLAQKLSPVRVMQTEVKDANGQITFTHRLIDGALRAPCEQSPGHKYRLVPEYGAPDPRATAHKRIQPTNSRHQ